ncbi:MAG TPA: hypothetical protein VN873_02420 [Candidatus Angelobacter sp.]|nr:hypothetical protein [Candidatus Angelobacter sp.]
MTVTNEIDLTHNWTSYDSPQFSAPSYVLGGSDFATWFYCMYPQYTNHIYTLGEGGSSWGGDITNSVELAYQPLWASFAVPGYSIFLANNNGGYGSNDVYTIGQLAAEAPTTTFNGTALTNEAIPTQPITWLFTGNPIEDFTAASNRNNGSLALNALEGTPSFDLYNELFTNTAGSSDGTNFYAGGHPHPGLSLVWAFWQLQNWGIETNIGTLTFDWGNAKAYTNFCAATGISVSGLTLSATVKWDRMPMAWDVPDGIITNNATSAFTLAPQFGTYFKWILQVTNLPFGNYHVFIDGSNVVELTSGQLAAGWNMFTNYNGALWAQRKEVLGRKRDQMGCDRVSLVEHSAGSTGILGVGDMVNYGSAAFSQYSSGKRGTNFTAILATDIAHVQQYDAYINAAAQQTNHTVQISQIIPLFAPFHQ